METENDIDQLFKRGLQEPEIPFNELDWEKMERKLDQHNTKRVLPLWLFNAAGIAAVLTVFLFWLLITPVSEEQQMTQLPVKDKPAVSAGKTVPSTMDVRLRPKGNLTDGGSGWSAAFGETAQAVAEKHISLLPVRGSQLLAPVSANALPVITLVKPWLTTPQLKAQTDQEILAQKANALANSKDPFEKLSAAEIANSVQKNMEKALGQQSSLILTAMAAPDITSAASSKPAKISSNLGMLATYALGPRFSVTSGAIYAKKYYNSAGTVPDGTYTAGANLGWEVKADCNVLDIPLNVNYKVLTRKRLSLSVNSGLSSYIMLKEKYEYITEKPGNVQEMSTLELNNQNKHLFGVANVSVSLDHKISDNLSIGVQPFVKLPLTGIGNGNVNLRSTGVSFSLNIGLFPVKKTASVAANRYSSLR